MRKRPVIRQKHQSRRILIKSSDRKSPLMRSFCQSDQARSFERNLPLQWWRPLAYSAYSMQNFDTSAFFIKTNNVWNLVDLSFSWIFSHAVDRYSFALQKNFDLASGPWLHSAKNLSSLIFTALYEKIVNRSQTCKPDKRKQRTTSACFWKCQQNQNCQEKDDRDPPETGNNGIAKASVRLCNVSYICNDKQPKRSRWKQNWPLQCLKWFQKLRPAKEV